MATKQELILQFHRITNRNTIIEKYPTATILSNKLFDYLSEAPKLNIIPQLIIIKLSLQALKSYCPEQDIPKIHEIFFHLMNSKKIDNKIIPLFLNIQKFNIHHHTNGDNYLHTYAKSHPNLLFSPGILELLLAAGIDPNQKNNEGDTPFGIHLSSAIQLPTITLKIFQKYNTDPFVENNKKESPCDYMMKNRLAFNRFLNSGFDFGISHEEINVMSSEELKNLLFTRSFFSNSLF